MKRSDGDLNRLFHDMASQAAAPESVSDQSRRRQRAIGGMRALHRSIADDQLRTRSRRRYWSLGLAAAAVALCGSALAGAGGLLHFSALPRAPQARSAARDHTREALSNKPLAPVPDATAVIKPSVEARPVASSDVVPAAALPNKPHGAELEEVNRLFAEAKRARREHRDADALALLQRLLAEHSGSVLTHEASVERFRALVRLGRTAEAQRYAGLYLARYPNGFAADEARRVVSGDTP